MKRVYNLDGLDCANCAAKIENALNARDDVISASVSFYDAETDIGNRR